MIVRILAIDPRPRKDESDLRVYQVPEHSREMELLIELFEDAKIEWTVVKFAATKVWKEHKPK